MLNPFNKEQNKLRKMELVQRYIEKITWNKKGLIYGESSKRNDKII